MLNLLFLICLREFNWLFESGKICKNGEIQVPYLKKLKVVDFRNLLVVIG